MRYYELFYMYKWVSFKGIKNIKFSRKKTSIDIFYEVVKSNAISQNFMCFSKVLKKNYGILINFTMTPERSETAILSFFIFNTDLFTISLLYCTILYCILLCFLFRFYCSVILFFFDRVIVSMNKSNLIRIKSTSLLVESCHIVLKLCQWLWIKVNAVVRTDALETEHVESFFIWNL